LIYYTRRQIVELLELEEGFLVSLEREDIVLRDAPPESGAEFSERMLERARVAQNLVRDLEVNLPGVAVIVRLTEEMAGLRRHLEDLLDRLGERPRSG
jgi:hypothetical protein